MRRKGNQFTPPQTVYNQDPEIDSNGSEEKDTIEICHLWISGQLKKWW